MELKIYPDSILSKKCAEVLPGDPEVRGILKEMSRKLYEWNGAGLAAPQVGILKKIVVIDIRDEPPVLYQMINPKIIWKSEELIESKEGCLSLPELRETVIRHERVRVEYLDENFEQRFLEGSDFLSCCLQHELDHLEGRLYIDRLSRLKKSRAIAKFKKLMSEDDREENEDDEDFKKR